jgi:2,5-furandicarboxylate decarboxylase 1
LREFLQALEKGGWLKTVDQPLSTDREIAAVLLAFEQEALFFRKVLDSRLALAGNLYCNRRNLALGLSTSSPKNFDVGNILMDAMRDPSSTIGNVAGFHGSEFDSHEDADLSALPILKHFDKEAGKYISAGIVAARFPGTDEENLSFHRMLVLSKDHVAARIVPRHLAKIARDSRGKKVPVSIIIGPPPPVFVAASLQIEYGVSEYRVANKLSNGKLRLMSSETNDIAVPVDSEIVLEGELDFDELAREGPFVDLTRTYDDVRSQPVIRLQRMHYNRDSVYQAVLASSAEHSLFMGLPQELKIREALSKSVPSTRGVNLTQASNGYFHCVVSIEKANDGDGKTAILNCFAASHPLKLVIAVDSDVDPFDLQAVEWALATRFQADRGIVVINGARGSSLDPSSAKTAVTSKLGLDATLPVNQEKTLFERAQITLSDRASSVISHLRNC